MKEELRQFDDIRPFEPEELPEVFDRLLADEQFKKVLAYLYPGVPLETIRHQLHGCKSTMDFQLTFIYGLVDSIMAKISHGYDMETGDLDRKTNYTFISNHRDIVLDSGLLDMLLIKNHFSTTCEIAIGDNLLKLSWIKDLVRLNKSFIVQRGLPMRQMLVASKHMSEYMHYVINEKHENVWIAQREGRAKDSDDRTNKGILQMMAMGSEGSVIDRLKHLRIVPLSISYEYDPCDFLKAKEFQQRRDMKDFRKGPMDDVISMKTGFMGFKGKVHYHCSSCLNDYLSTLDADMPKGELFSTIAEYIDKEIHHNYRLYPNNYIALDELRGFNRHRDKYTEAEKTVFDQYITTQMAKIDLTDKDEDFLRERMLTMYANPAINYLKTQINNQ